MPHRQKEFLSITTPHVAGDEDIGAIRNIVGFHIRLAHGAVYRHFAETFADLDLTQKQVSVLWLVNDHRDIAQTGLACFILLTQGGQVLLLLRDALG